MCEITEVIDDFVKKPTIDEADKLVADVLAKVGGDVEKALRMLAGAVLLNAGRASVAVLVAEQLAPKPKCNGRRPNKKPGLYVPVRYRTKRKVCGAPQKYALPLQTKQHALNGAEYMKANPEKNAKQAAIFEIRAHGVAPNKKLIRNLQQRISEHLRGA